MLPPANITFTPVCAIAAISSPKDCSSPRVKRVSSSAERISTVPFVSDDDASRPQVRISTRAGDTCRTSFAGRFGRTMPPIMRDWSMLPPSRRTVRMLSTSSFGAAGASENVYRHASAIARASTSSWPYCFAATTGRSAEVTASTSRMSATLMVARSSMRITYHTYHPAPCSPPHTPSRSP